VVQQTGDGIHPKMTVSDPGDAHELEADAMARAVMQQEHAPSIDRAGALQEEEEKNKHIAAKHSDDVLRRQPEEHQLQDEEEKKLSVHS
jgi:hypothetical protein